MKQMILQSGAELVDSGQLQTLIAAWPGLPYRSIFESGEARALATDYLRRLKNHRMAVSFDEGVVGAWCPLAWDSAIFGLSMGRVEFVWNRSESESATRAMLDRIIEDARNSGVRHLSARLDLWAESTIRVFEDAGFRLVDSLQTLAMEPKPVGLPGARPTRIREFRESDRRALLEITRESFGSRNRFLADPNLNPEKAPAVYEAWAENCFSGRRGDFVKVCEVDGVPAGYITCASDSIQLDSRRASVAMIDLIAVSSKFRGGGVGRELVESAQAWAASKQAIMTVGTRCDNFAALSLYLRSGFQFHSSKVGMHLWLK